VTLAPPAPPTDHPPGAATVLSSRRIPEWAVLAVACLGQFMVVLDVSVVNVALPSIRADLGFSGTGLQWVINAYTITFAGFLLLGGRAADLFGQRRVFLSGLGLFTLASLVGGFADDQGTLLGARAAQGLGAAVLSPATLTVLTTTFTGPARAKALGAWSAVAGAGGAAGSLAGGILTDLAGWRWVLFINVPIGVLGLVAARVALGERRAAAASRRLDLPGAALVTVGLVALVAGIVNSDSHGWSSARTWGPAVGGVVLLGLFAAFEARVALPLVPLRLFTIGALRTANIVIFFVTAAVFASWYFLSLYMQNVLHWSPLKAGLAFVPQTLAIVVGAQLSSRLVGRTGARPLLLVGMTSSAVGLLWLSRLPVRGAYLAHLAVPSVLVTLGVGLAFTPLALAATNGVDAQDAGLASGLLSTMRQVGGSLGLAVLATIAVGRTDAAARRGLDAVGALVAGYRVAFGVGACLAVVAGLASLALPAVRRERAPADAVVPGRSAR